MHCKCKFEKHKQAFLSGNCEQTFPNKKHKQSAYSGKARHVAFLRVRCSILILLIKTVRCSVVRCSVVRFSVVRCSIFRCSVVRCSVVRCSVVRCSVVPCSVVPCSVVRCSVVPCSKPHRNVKCDSVWQSVQHGTCVLQGWDSVVTRSVCRKTILELVYEGGDWRAVVFMFMNCRLTYKMIISTR